MNSLEQQVEVLRVGPYIRQALLGTGACGQVFRGHHTILEHDVALKKLVLPPDCSPEEAKNLTDRFFQEAKIAVRLKHPAIVEVFDLISHGNEHFMAMELLSRDDLQGRWQSGHMTLGDFLKTAQQLAEGLNYAHREGVIHRDIKPDNILFNLHDDAKICDFGVAYSPLKSPEKESFVGTLGFMAPEQIYGSEQVDARSDIYSLGATLYYILLQQLPFESKDVRTFIQNVFEASVPEPHRLNPMIPTALSAVLLKALCRRPEDRFQSMTEFAQYLERLPSLLRAEELALNSKKLLSEKALFPDQKQDFPQEELLSAMALPQKLQALCEEGATACLLLSTSHEKARVFLQEGKIKAAKIDARDLQGVDALYDLSCWPKCQYRFEQNVQIEVQEDFEYIPADLLILDLLDCQNEYRKLWKQHALDSKKRVMKCSKQEERSQIDPHYARVMLAADGQRQLKDFIRSLNLDRLSALKTVHALLEEERITLS